FVEDKFDGIRAQLHRNSKRAEIYSRDLRRITDQFPELADHALKFEADLILDGEIVAFELGRKLTFFDLQRRLGRESEGADLFSTGVRRCSGCVHCVRSTLAQRPLIAENAARGTAGNAARPEIAAALSGR